MPAGVHLAIGLRSVVDRVLFQDRQSIHVGAHQHDLFRATLPGSLDKPGDASNGNSGANVFDAHGIQALGHQLCGFELLKTELRMLVQVAPVGNHAGHDLVDIVLQVSCRCNHKTRCPFS